MNAPVPTTEPSISMIASAGCAAIATRYVVGSAAGTATGLGTADAAGRRSLGTSRTRIATSPKQAPAKSAASDPAITPVRQVGAVVGLSGGSDGEAATRRALGRSRSVGRPVPPSHISTGRDAAADG